MLSNWVAKRCAEAGLVERAEARPEGDERPSREAPGLPEEAEAAATLPARADVEMAPATMTVTALRRWRLVAASRGLLSIDRPDRWLSMNLPSTSPSSALSNFQVPLDRLPRSRSCWQRIRFSCVISVDLGKVPR